MKNTALTAAIVAIIFGVGGFAGGMKYQQSRRGNFIFQRNGNAPGRFMGQNGANARGGFRPISGEIVSSDNASITVKLPDGSSKIVLISGTTAINKAAAGTSADLKPGERIIVFGTENTDGSITAQNVQLGIALGGRMMGATPSSTPTGK